MLTTTTTYGQQAYRYPSWHSALLRLFAIETPIAGELPFGLLGIRGDEPIAPLYGYAGHNAAMLRDERIRDVAQGGLGFDAIESIDDDTSLLFSKRNPSANGHNRCWSHGVRRICARGST